MKEEDKFSSYLLKRKRALGLFFTRIGLITGGLLLVWIPGTLVFGDILRLERVQFILILVLFLLSAFLFYTGSRLVKNGFNNKRLEILFIIIDVFIYVVFLGLLLAYIISRISVYYF